MTDDLWTPFGDALTADPRDVPLRLRQAVVIAVVGSLATIKIGDGDVEIPGVPSLASYGPVVGDVVNVLQQGPSLLILDTVDDEWQSYPVAPGLRSYGGDAAIGSGGGISATYTRIGRTVHFRVVITVGTGTTWGTSGGGLTNLLPFAARWTGFENSFQVWTINNLSAGWHNSWYAIPSSGHHDFVNGGAGGITGAPAAGEMYVVRGTYEAAA